MIDSNRQRNLIDALSQRILVLDGAMGTMIQALNLTEKDYACSGVEPTGKNLSGNHDLLSLTRPDLVARIHRTYLEAGADIIETNTFSANAISQQDYGTARLCRRMNKASAEIARSEADRQTALTPDKPRFVAGSLGPTNCMCSLSPDLDDPACRKFAFDDLQRAYREQILGLKDGGVDIILIETIFDTLNAKAAIAAALELSETCRQRIPLWISGTITDHSGRTLSGQTLEAFWISVSHAKPLVVGLNCAMGPEPLLPHIEKLSKLTETHIAVYPNAGLPNDLGDYDMTPTEMAAQMQRAVANFRVNIVGGCCGTTPEHIRELARLVNGHKPKEPGEIVRHSSFCGLEPLVVRPEMPFINIGERTNVAGSRKFARLIREEKYSEAVDIARRQVKQGAQMLDINVDDPMTDGSEMMTRFLRTLAMEPEVCRVPFMIDSSRWETVEAGLKCVQGKAIVNSISLKDGEDEFLRRARVIRKYGAAVVVMAFDETGQAVTRKHKVAVATRACTLLIEEAAFPPEDIIIDPNILTIGTGLPEHNDYALAFIEATREIKQTLPGVMVSGGVSNLSYAFRGRNDIREALHAVFLYHAIGSGLDMGLVNVAKQTPYDDLPAELRKLAEALVLNTDPDATDKLLATETVTQSRTDDPATDAWRDLDAGERLSYAVTHGIGEFVAQDALEALEILGTPLKVIQGPLAEGMSVVGERFGNGTMFLPQVIKSAQTMRKAVAAILPSADESELETSDTSRQTIILATVSGDVHDIGKNIVGVVLASNGFRVIDLGVMVDKEKILATAISERADAIGVSGLITPSLGEMIGLAELMQEHRLQIPLFIGGATTTPTHTAVKIAPCYDGPVVQVRNASVAATAVRSILDDDAGDDNIERYRQEQSVLRDQFADRKRQRAYVPYREATARKTLIDWNGYRAPVPSKPGLSLFEDIGLDRLIPYIDWTPFFKVFELRGRYPQILTGDQGVQASRLYNDARKMLDHIVRKKRLKASAVVGLFPANAVGDDIEVYDPVSHDAVLCTFNMLRRQRCGSDRQAFGSLADFVAPRDTGTVDWVGAFAVTTGLGLDEIKLDFQRENNNYEAILATALADRLAEALTEYLHAEVRTSLWGYAPDENLTPEELLAAKYRGIRPAPGYPTCPDHSEKSKVFDLLKVTETIGIELTDSYAMTPTASVAGWYFSHPESRYFSVGQIEKDQIIDYARRKDLPVAVVERLLATSLGYDPETSTNRSADLLKVNEG